MTDTTLLIDYDSGNLRSAEKALAKAAENSNLDRIIRISKDPEEIRKADRIVLPGVGAFADCRKGLLTIDGMKEAIYEVVRKKGNPFLGICVGMQLLAEKGHEFGVHKGIGWINGTVKPLDLPNTYKIPHMGWNTVTLSDNGLAHPVAKIFNQNDHVYFVHSYHMTLDAHYSDQILGTTDYGQDINALVGKDNMIGAQFHPEKSQAVGLKFLEAFLKWTV